MHFLIELVMLIPERSTHRQVRMGTMSPLTPRTRSSPTDEANTRRKTANTSRRILRDVREKNNHQIRSARTVTIDTDIVLKACDCRLGASDDHMKTINNRDNRTTTGRGHQRTGFPDERSPSGF